MTKIILADDSVTIQKVVELTFADQKSQVTAVSDGAAALEKAKAERPDIIISDVVMPGMDGYELCQKVKADPALKTVPFLFLKGTFESFDEDRARECGADGFIVKPFESQELIGKVNELIAAASSAPASEAPPAVEAPPVPAAPAVAAAAPEPAAPPPPAAAPPPPVEAPAPPPPADLISTTPPKADELAFDLGPELAADEMISGSDDVSSVEDDLFGMEEETILGKESEQEEDLWSEVSLRDNTAPLIEDNVLEDESFWGTGSEDDGVAAPQESRAPSSEALLEDMEEPEILDLTDEAEAPAAAEILDLTDEAEEPVAAEILDLTDEAEEPVAAEILDLTDEAEEPAAAEILDLTDEAEAPVEPEMLDFTDEAEAPVEPEMLDFTDETEVPVAAEILDLTDEAEAPVDVSSEMDIFGAEPVAAAPSIEEGAITEPTPEEPVVAPVETLMMEEVVAPVEAEMIEEAVVTPEPELAAVAAAPAVPSGTTVSKDELEKVLGTRLEEAVREILGPVINEAARKIVEEVAWDVIPDLAEAMIQSEIERIRKTG